EKSSKSQFRQTVMDTLASAEKAYWDLQSAIMNQRAQEASLKLAQDFLEQTRINVRVGRLPPSEITQAEASVADREHGIITGLAGTFLPFTQTFVTADPSTPPGCVPDPVDPTICHLVVNPPDLSIGNSYTQIRNRDFDSWSGQLQLSIPLGNRFADAAYTASKYQQEQSKLSIERLEQTAMVQVRNAVRQVDTDLKRVNAARVNTRLQTEKLSAEQKKYE